MTDPILVLSGALGLLGLAIFGLLQILKSGTSSDWRKGSRIGRAIMKAAPLLLGAVLCGIPGVLHGLADIFGELPSLSLGARIVVGLGAGSLATTTHSLIRSRIVDALGAGPNVAP